MNLRLRRAKCIEQRGTELVVSQSALYKNSASLRLPLRSSAMIASKSDHGFWQFAAFFLFGSDAHRYREEFPDHPLLYSTRTNGEPEAAPASIGIDVRNPNGPEAAIFRTWNQRRANCRNRGRTAANARSDPDGSQMSLMRRVCSAWELLCWRVSAEGDADRWGSFLISRFSSANQKNELGP